MSLRSPGYEDPGSANLTRLTRSNARLIGLFAPPGYAKWRLAGNFAAQFDRAISLDAQERSPDGLLAQVAETFGTDLEDWRSYHLPSCVAIDHAEVMSDAALTHVLERLIEAAPPAARIVVCGSREPSFSFIELLDPELTLTLRARDLALPLQALRHLVETEPNVSDMTVYWVYQLSGGWPLVSQYLLRAAIEGRFERDMDDLHQLAWADLFDWLEAKVTRLLDAECMSTLVEAATRMDARVDDFQEAERDAAMRLVREFQLADVGTVGELRVTPFVRLYLLVRRLPAMRAVALRMAQDAREPAVSKARALINVGEFGAAESILQDVDEKTCMSLGDYPYPGVLLERLHPNKPPLHLFAHVWAGLGSVRAYAQAPAALAEEGAVLLSQCPADAPVRRWVLWFTAILNARAGRIDSALEYVRELETLAEDPMTDALVELGYLVVDLVEGRYAKVFERWSRGGRALVNQPTLYANMLRFVVRSTIATGAFARAKEQLRLMASLTHVGGSPLLYAAAAAEATLLACMAGDSSEFERRRSELLRVLLNCEAPVLWRFSAATYGLEVTGPAPIDPFLEGAVALLLALQAGGASAPERALAAVRSSDALGHAWLRSASRVVAAALHPAQSAQLLSEAFAIARDLDAPAMLEAIERMAAGDADAGMFAAVISQLRIRALEAQARAGESHYARGGLHFDVGTGRITRDGEPLDVSDGTLALIALIAVRRGSVKRDVILDTLWPNVDAVSANSSLKMCAHRARLQLGDAHAILVSRGIYSFGSSLRTNVEAILEYASRSVPLPLPDAIRGEMEALFATLRAGAHCAWAPWTWFLPHARKFADAEQSIGAMLVRDLLERKEYHQALSTGREMVAAQPLDEAPRVLVVRALLALNNRAAAIEEYRQFQQLLRAELGIEPSLEIQRLLTSA